MTPFRASNDESVGRVFEPPRARSLLLLEKPEHISDLAVCSPIRTAKKGLGDFERF